MLSVWAVSLSFKNAWYWRQWSILGVQWPATWTLGGSTVRIILSLFSILESRAIRTQPKRGFFSSQFAITRSICPSCSILAMIGFVWPERSRRCANTSPRPNKDERGCRENVIAVIFRSRTCQWQVLIHLCNKGPLTVRLLSLIPSFHFASLAIGSEDHLISVSPLYPPTHTPQPPFPSEKRSVQCKNSYLTLTSIWTWTHS